MNPISSVVYQSQSNVKLRLSETGYDIIGVVFGVLRASRS